MKKQSSFYKCWSLFITFFSVGLFTFGGGYAMLPIIQREVVEKKKWINEIELLDILAIAESTPGPIAVNCATYVGYKVGGFFGSVFALLGLIIPSFTILLVISTFYDAFLKITIIEKMFSGLKIGVIILLINAVIKLAKLVKFNKLAIITASIALVGVLVDTFLNLNIPSISIIFIVFGLIVGVVSTIITSKKGGNK